MAEELVNYLNPIGRPLKYKTPKALWNKFLEYVEYINNNLIEMPQKLNLKGSKEAITERSEGKVLVKAPLTKEGWMLFAGIPNWTDFKQSITAQKGDFPNVIATIDTYIRNCQITGGMVGLYNHNITARLNGLTDKQEQVAKIETSAKIDTSALEAELERLGYAKKH